MTTNDNKIYLLNAALNVVVIDPATLAPFPIFQNGDTTTSMDIGALTGYGQSFDANSSVPFPVADGMLNFQLTGLVLYNGPDVPDGPQVKMQGAVTFTKDFPVATFVKGAKVEVGQNNYVIADRAGVSLTGLDAVFPITSGEVGGFPITGSVKVSYSNTSAGHAFGFGGQVQVSSKPQDGNPDGSNKKVAFGNVAGQIDANFLYADGVTQVTRLTVGVTGSLMLFGATVSTIDNQPMAFTWDSTDSEFKVGGGVQFKYKDTTIGATFRSPTNPTVTIKDGLLDTLDLTVFGTIDVAGAVISSDPNDGLNFHYDRVQGQFEMWGGLTVTLPFEKPTVQFSGQLGTSQDDPGVEIVDGQLQKFEAGLNGSFALGGVKITLNGAGLKRDLTKDLYKLHGTFGVALGPIQTSVTLGEDESDGSHPGLVIQDGHVTLDSLSFTLDNAKLGPLTLKNLTVAYSKSEDGTSFDLAVSGRVAYLDKFEVDGGFELKDGKIDEVSLGYRDPTGIPLGETGIKLTELSATVKNIETPSQIVVVGTVGVVYGDTIKMLSKDVNLFHARGTVTVDADEFILECRAELAAYSTDGGFTYTGVLGTVGGKLDLNWQSQVYSLHVQATGILGVFDFEGDLLLRYGRDIEFLATADVTFPTWVPFIGGQKLGGLGFYFQHVWAQPALSITSSTTIAAWLDFDLGTTVTVGVEVKIDGSDNPTWSLVGADQVTGFRQTFLNPGPTTFTYTTDLDGVVPAGATSLVVKADWSNPYPGVNIDGMPRLKVRYTPAGGGDSVTYTEDQFAAHGITVVNDGRLSNGTSAVIQIASQSADPYQPLPGSYAVLVELDAVTNPFPNSLPVFDLAEGKDFGLLPPSVVFGTVSGNQQVGGKVQPTAIPRAGWAVGLLADRVAVAINAGGANDPGFVADGYFDAGQTATTTTHIDTSRVAGPAAEAVYQVGRQGTDGGGFNYVIPGLNPGATYTVRLHFAEIVWQVAGQRQFDVDINGSRVLTDFDIFAATGDWFTAYTADFETTADAQGRIIVAFTNGSAGTAQVNALQVLEPAGLLDTATTDAEGNYALVGYGAGQYTVVQSPPPGWEQVAPEYSTPTFDPIPLTVKSQVPVPGQNSDRLATADFDGDGRTDVLVAGQINGDSNGSYAYYLLNKPDGTFQFNLSNILFDGDGPGTSVPVAAIGDFNGDHRPDVAVVYSNGGTSGLFVYLNTGNPNNLFSLWTNPANSNDHNFWKLPGLGGGESYTAVAAADMNRDGLDDLVIGVSTQPGQQAWLIYAQNAAAPAARGVQSSLVGTADKNTPGPYALDRIAVADADGNGYPDVVMVATYPFRDVNPPYEWLTYGSHYGIAVLSVAYNVGASGLTGVVNYQSQWGSAWSPSWPSARSGPASSRTCTPASRATSSICSPRRPIGTTSTSRASRSAPTRPGRSTRARCNISTTPGAPTGRQPALPVRAAARGHDRGWPTARTRSGC